MADIDMADAAPPAPAKSKALAKSVKAGGSADISSDGKKRFEVKKVHLTRAPNCYVTLSDRHSGTR